MTLSIALSRGKVALIDDDDSQLVGEYRWWLYPVATTTHHAGTQITDSHGNRHYLAMHRLIMNAPAGMDVDHINGNGLDNRKINLRLCARGENVRNRRPQVRRSSRYKGVVWHKQTNCWMARISLHSKEHYLGLFHNELDAARAYNAAAKKLHGSFARLNELEA